MTSDLRIALRQLRKSPGFAVTAILTLALGIGANAVVFSVMNAVVLKPVNVPHAQNLYMVQRFQYPSQSYPDYLDLRDRNRTFESLVMFSIMARWASIPAGIRRLRGPTWPAGNYFDALGIQPYLGRFFHAADEHGANSAPYVVLSYAYWHGHFHGDAGVVGRTVEINKHQFTIIGVAPPEFRGTELFFAPAMWIPMVEQPTVEGFNELEQRGNHSAFVVGRLKPGVTPAQASGGPEYSCRLAGQNLSGRRRWREVHAGSSRADGGHARRAGAGVHGGPDAAGRADSAGGVRQPGKPVCGARGGSRQGDGAAAGAGITARNDPAPDADRGGAGFAGWGSAWAGRGRCDPALAERVAADSRYSHQRAGESRMPPRTWWRCCWRWPAACCSAWCRCGR